MFKISETSLKILVFVLLSGLGLIITGCEDLNEASWAEIYVMNNSSHNMNVIIEKSEKDSAGNYSTQRVHNISGVPRNTEFRYNTSSGSYRVIVQGRGPSNEINIDFHFPRGGSTFTRMSDVVKLNFDGNQLTRTN